MHMLIIRVGFRTASRYHKFGFRTCLKRFMRGGPGVTDPGPILPLSVVAGDRRGPAAGRVAGTAHDQRDLV